MLPSTIGSILIGLALLIVLGLVLVRPFFSNHGRQKDVPIGPRAELLARKETLLFAIRGLDFDHDTGKLPEPEYEAQRAVLLAEAADTLRALDDLPADAAGADVYDQIEAAVSQLRSSRAPDGKAPSHYCTHCGQGLDSNDRFCARCGQPVLTLQPTA